jgi:hypothetical protein
MKIDAFTEKLFLVNFVDHPSIHTRRRTKMSKYHVYVSRNVLIGTCYVVEATSEEDAEEKFKMGNYIDVWDLTQHTSDFEIDDIVLEDDSTDTF